MKHTALIVFFYLSFLSLANSQEIKTIKPTIGDQKIFQVEHQTKWERAWYLLDAINDFTIDYDTLSNEDQQLINLLEVGEGPISEIGDTWNSVAYPDSIIASSTLKGHKDVRYDAKNLNDFNLLTAWVPCNKKTSIGEKVSFYFKPFNPRVNTIIIFNGYLKNIELWKQNSRVKKFKMYVDKKPFAILDLQDTTAPQSFNFEPLQSKIAAKPLIITLEILEIYKGEKWNDTVITEINFDGLDVF